MSKNTKHEIHSHPKSVLSGVYYLTDSAKSGGLKLLLPNNHAQLYQNQKQLVNKNTLIFEHNNHEITKKDIVFYPNKNDMIIFNSYIFHYVEEYKDNLDRLCIAWDAKYTV